MKSYYLLIISFTSAGNLLCMDTSIKELNQKPLLAQNQSVQTQKEMLFKAVINGDTVYLQALIDKNTLLEATDEYGLSPLHIAALFGYCDVIKILINKNASVAVTSPGGLSPLHIASDYNNTQAMEILIASNANIESIVAHGQTALHKAAQKGYLESIKLLISHGANIRAINHNKETPLLMAVIENKTKCWHMLIHYSFTLFPRNITITNEYRRRCKAALLCLSKIPIPEDKYHKILLNQPLLYEVANILIDELQRGFPIKAFSLLHYEEVKKTAALLILDALDEHFTLTYVKLEKEHILKQFFALKNRHQNILPLIRNGIDSQATHLKVEHHEN